MKSEENTSGTLPELQRVKLARSSNYSTDDLLILHSRDDRRAGLPNRRPRTVLAPQTHGARFIHFPVRRPAPQRCRDNAAF
ncbi:MAG: hypothetical protein U1F83_20385 [Verrucomicrobiota bacterium]